MFWKKKRAAGGWSTKKNN